ncbi:hypothetical protein D3C84_1192000 [compost metagenome]
MRSIASWSSRLMFLMAPKSSLAATSLIGISWMPSFFPPGAYMNRLRKLPGPLLLRIAVRRSVTKSSLWAESVM